MKNESLTVPVAIIVYNRPNHTKSLIDALRTQLPSKLYVIADGPKPGSDRDRALVEKTRDEVRKIDWPCEVNEVFSDVNLGLRARVLTGLDAVFQREKFAIILEDDCIPDPSFFPYCEDLLSLYSTEKDVGIIAGHNAGPVINLANSYLFSSFTPIWGWATWSRVWLEFRASAQVETWSPTEVKDVLSTFSTQLMSRQFKKMMLSAFKLDTWDISFAVFLRQRRFVNAIPKVSLISNIGFGQESTHTKFKPFDIELESGGLSFPLKHPDTISDNLRYERRLASKKVLSWLSYPVIHPLQFIQRLVSYLKLRNLD
jgi:hypothetical protein